MIDRPRGHSNGGRSDDETAITRIEVAELTSAVIERSSLLYSLRDHRDLFLAQDPTVLTPHASEPTRIAAVEQAGRLTGAALAAASAGAAAA